MTLLRCRGYSATLGRELSTHADWDGDGREGMVAADEICTTCGFCRECHDGCDCTEAGPKWADPDEVAADRALDDAIDAARDREMGL